MCHHTWITTPLMRYMVNDLFPEDQGKSWAYLRWSWWSWCGLWVTLPCQTWSMPNMTLIKWWHSISIPVASYLDHYTTGMIQALGSNIQGNSWVCLRYSWKLCRDLWGDSSLSDMAHALYNTPYRYHQHWTTTPLIRTIVQALSYKT